MGKPTGFLEFERKSNVGTSPLERIKNYKEQFTSAGAVDDDSEASKVTVSGARLEENSYFGEKLLPSNHIEDEEQSVRWNREYVEEFNNGVKERKAKHSKFFNVVLRFLIISFLKFFALPKTNVFIFLNLTNNLLNI